MVKPLFHSHAIILPVQIKTACFLLCLHSYMIAYYIARKSTQTSVRKILKFSVLVGTAIKSTETSS